ncbi:MAG: tetratricopeptide repeat protein [Bacteroidetes bacterium]|nr:tetratricopeptide repeat protein [Bacteroidota bacterium]
MRQLIKLLSIGSIVFLLSLSSFSQQTNEMQKFLEKAAAYEENAPDSALIYYRKVIPDLIYNSESFNNWINEANNSVKYFVAVALAQSGRIEISKGQKTKGINNLELSFEIASNINNDALSIFCSDNLAVAYAQAKSYEKAITYFKHSQFLYEKTNNINGIAYCLGNIGAIYANMDNLYGAATYYEQLLNLQRKSGQGIGSVSDILNIAMLYTRLNENSKAFRFWEMALKESLETNNKQYLGLIYSNLGSIHYKTTQYDRALVFYNKFLEHSEETQNLRDIVLALNNIAIIQFHKNNLNESVQYWELALQKAMQTGQGQVVFDALINLSNIYNLLGNHNQSIIYYEQYLALAKQINDPVFTARSLIGMAEIQFQAGNYNKSRDYYIEAYDTYNTTKKFAEASKINNLIAQTYIREYKINEGIAQYRNALDYNLHSDSLILADTYHGMADAFRMLRQFESADIYYQAALKIYTFKNKTDKAASIINAMAYMQEVNGDLPKAVVLYEQALSMAAASGNKEAGAAIYNNLGVVYRQLGDLPRARNSYLKAMTIYEQINNQDAIAYCYNNLGIIYELSGDLENASIYYEKSLTIKKNTLDVQGLSTSLLNIGNIQKLQGNFDKARDYYEQALALSEQINDSQGIAVVLANLAALYIEIGDYYKTIAYANQSKQISEAGGFLSSLRESYRQLAWAYAAINDNTQAEEAYLKVTSINHEEIDRNFSILSESEKEMFFKTVENDFARFHSFALERFDENPSISIHVYNNLLKNKGLLLKSSTAMRNAILGSKNEFLIKTFDLWIQLKQEIARLYTLPVSERDTDVEQLEEQANSLERTLVRNSAEFSQFDKSVNVYWEDIKNKLEANEAAIEFTNFKHLQGEVIYCALIITKKSDYPVMIPLFKESQLESLMGAFAGNNYQYINNIYGRLVQPEVKLYELIWMPLVKYLTGVNKVYISPSGLLHKVSFAAISKGQSGYIIDDYEIYNLSTTAHSLALMDVVIDENKALALFGGINYTINSKNKSWKYLPGTLEEIDIIEKIASNTITDIKRIAGNYATEEMFKEYAPHSNILHIATHGFFYPDPELIDNLMDFEIQFEDVQFRGGTPSFGFNNFVRNNNPLMRSGLVFAGVNDYWTGEKEISGDDGVLTALEVINIDLRKTELVVMSACETGLGEIKGSEGVYGLQRSFKMAGASYLIMSLWQVPDKETSEFMSLFYEFLSSGNSLTKAFAKTQKIMREKYDPYFWAAFVLIE